MLFYFQPADMITQVLNFGVPTQIDVQLQGRDRENNKKIAALLQQKMGNIPGLVDAHIQQELNAPEMYYAADRARAQELGLNIQEVANNLNISLSSSEQVTPKFWTDTKNGIPYYFAVQTPEYRMNSVTKSIVLTALAGSLAISEPAPASAFSRGGGGFHAGGFGGGMRGFGGGQMFTGRRVARGGAFAGQVYGGIGAYGGYGG